MTKKQSRVELAGDLERSAASESTKETLPAAASAKQPEETVSNQPPLVIPPLLLEGDEPSEGAAAKPAEKYDLGTAPTAHGIETQATELPEAYGTERVSL